VQARTFQAEGSDTGMGVGARYIAMGGSGVAASNDGYAAYYNPAGLADLDGIEIAASRQLNAKLRPVNYFGIAARLPFVAGSGYRATVAGIYFPRVHAHATGTYNENEIESVFLRYLLPGVSGSFTGEIDSKTKVYRLALGLGPLESDRWSVGLNIDYIDCKTNFCGVHATSNGYTMISSGATTVSYGAGFRYRLSPSLTLAGAISDIGADLDVGVITTDNAGTRQSTFKASFPQKVSLGMAYRWGASTLVTGNYEITKGNYGNNRIDMQFLRAGAEISHSPSLSSRFGFVAPIRIHSEKVRAIKLPFPVVPTVGLGWRQKHIRVDLGVYAHPLMSLHKNRIAPAADLSVTVVF